jgi:plastocyanin
MSLRFLIAAAVVGLALAAVAAGCSDDEDQRPAAATVAATVAAAAPAAAATEAVSVAAPGPATFKVIAGKAQGAIDVEQFMPYDVHVREGDSIEWTAQGIEGHTVSFADEQQLRGLLGSYLVPDPQDPGSQLFNPEVALRSRTGETFAGDGTYVNSGFFGVPAEQTYKLTFTKRGIYPYLCLVHPLWMRGTVSVDAPDAQVAAPETVAARGTALLAQYIAEGQRALAQATAAARAVRGPDGTMLHRVAVGLTTPYGQVAAFVSPVLDIKAGDTVIFESDDRDFHNVVFKGDLKDPPPGISVRADPEGRGIIVGLDRQSAAADPPPGGFDERTFLSSGSMGILMPRSTWRLRFDKPGTYAYWCTIHVLAGMAGVVNVR